jgi:polyisoprenoid-binding protein YceI
MLAQFGCRAPRRSPPAALRIVEALRVVVKLRVAVGLLFAAAALPGQVRSYRIEPAPDSRFALEVFKTGLMSGKKHLLVFERYAGRLEYDAAHPEQSHIEWTVEAGSLVVQDDWVSEKDRAKIADEALNNELAVKQYPEIRFRSSSIRAADAAGRYPVQGDLTIRDKTRPVEVGVRLRKGPGGSLLFEGEATVSMKDYGMKPPSAALGLIGTKDAMTVSFQLRAEPQGAGAP